MHGFTFPASGCTSAIAYGPRGVIYVASDLGVGQLDPNTTASALAAGPDGELALGGRFQYRMDLVGEHVETTSASNGFAAILPLQSLR